jgi:hypothetical protein
MKLILSAALAAALSFAGAAVAQPYEHRDDARVVDHRDTRDARDVGPDRHMMRHHHRHQVCVMRHHHRVCHWN